jgi:hypothetical protein
LRNILTEQHIFYRREGLLHRQDFIFLGKLPTLVITDSFLNAAGNTDFSRALREPAGKLTPAVIETLPEPDFETDKFLPQVKYLHRIWKDADMFFIFNEGQESLSFKAYMTGNGKTEIWDASTGKIIPLQEVSVENGRIRASLKLEGWETMFIVIRK